MRSSTARIDVRVTSEERDAFFLQAQAEGYASVSEWFRALASERVSRKPTLEERVSKLELAAAG